MTTEQDKSNAQTPEPQVSGLLRAASKVGGWTMLSRILGFVRDILLARVLGSGLLAGAFFVGVKLPHLFRRLFSGGPPVPFTPLSLPAR